MFENNEETSAESQETQEEQPQAEGQEGQESAGEEQETSSPDVKEGAKSSDGKEKLDPNIYDEDGVPYKNRAKEYERKYYASKEYERKYYDSLEKRAKDVEQPKQEQNVEELTEEEQQIEKVVAKRQYVEMQAQNIFDETIGEMAVNINPEYAELKSEIEKQIKQIPNLRDRANTKVIQSVAFMVFGQKHSKKTSSPEVAPKKKLVGSARGNGSEVLSPSPKGGSSSEITLTDDEQEYAEHHRFIGMFGNDEIRDMYKRVNKTKGKGG